MTKTVEELKQEALAKLGEINKDNLTLYDFKVYAETLSVIANIPDTSSSDLYKEMISKITDTTSGFAVNKPLTLAEMKGE